MFTRWVRVKVRVRCFDVTVSNVKVRRSLRV